jgi:Flp pilus assembly protein TadG
VIAGLWKGQRGQSLTEFALVVPLLLLLIFGILDVGRYFYDQLELQLAAQETVRVGGLGRTDDEIRTFAINYLGMTDPALLAVTISPVEAERASGEYLTVALQRPFTFATPLPLEVETGIVNVRASSTIRVE